MNDKDGMTP